VSAVPQHDWLMPPRIASLQSRHEHPHASHINSGELLQRARVICFVVFVLLAVPHALDQGAIPMPIVKGRRVA
jgi:hypothetical protein